MKAPIIVSVFFLGIILSLNNFLYSQTAVEINDYLKNTVSAKSSTNDLENLRSLYYDFNTTAILSKDNVKIVGEDSPKAIFINLSDIDAVYEKNPKLSEIEILIISIEGGEYAKLNLNNLKYLSKLKYIVFKSDVVVSSKDINSLIVNAKDVNYTLLYDNSIPQ